MHRVSFTKKKRSILALVSSTVLTTGLLSSVVFAQSLPTITSYSLGSDQTTLTINGTNFGSSDSNASVLIDGAPASITSWTNTSIDVSLPATDAPGTLSITTSNGQQALDAFSGVERGYYSLSSDGTVTATGSLQNFGGLNTLGQAVSSPAIQLIPTANYEGYWILTQNGGVYAFGDATNFGSVSQSIQAVSMAVLPSGEGAYVLSSTGEVYALGQAAAYGSPTGIAAASIATTSDGDGYWVLGTNGTVYSYGNAQNYGSPTMPDTSSTTTTSLANGSVVKASGSSAVFLVENGSLYHIPNQNVFYAMGLNFSQVQTVPSLNGYTLGLPMIVPYPDGTVLQAQGQSSIYLVENGVLRHIASASVFSDMGLSWSQVKIVSAIEPNWPIGSEITTTTPFIPNGSLYRATNTSAIYVVDNGSLDHIGSATAFAQMGYSWSEVQEVPSLPNLPQGPTISTAQAIFNNGTLWKAAGTSEIYVDQNGVMRHIPSASLFTSLGFQWSNVNTAPSLSMATFGANLGSTEVPSTTSSQSAAPVSAVSITPTTNGQGYWILLSNGQVETLGNAVTYGEPTSSDLGSATAVSMAVTPDQSGYTILASNGTTYNFGDALVEGSLPSGTVGISMSALSDGETTPPATTTTTQGNFLSMAYGSFLNPSGGSYNALVNDSAGISVINPTWFYVTQNPTTLAWDINSPPSGSQSVVTEAHSEGVQVWPMIGSPDIGPFQTDAQVSSLVNQIVTLAENNDYDGITIDFEPDSLGGMTLSQASQQYTYFISQLGPALESIGKKLMVDVYASSYPNTIFNYTAIAQYATYLNIMDYPEYNATTQAGPTSGLPWDISVVQNAISEGLSPSQIILGVAPYGHYWTFNNSGITGDGDVYDTQAASLLASNSSIVPIWDPTFQSEVFMTDEYLNSNDQWTVNPNGQAVAPTSVLSTADESSSLAQVKNLQGLLNYILLRYAVENNQTTPAYLAQDGYYGPLTAAAVTQFQQDFNVTGATAGVYDAATQAALKEVINNWGIGEYQYWVDTTASIQNRVQEVAEAYNLAGIAPWRLPFETSDYWQAIESTVNVSHTDE